MAVLPRSGRPGEGAGLLTIDYQRHQFRTCFNETLYRNHQGTNNKDGSGS